MPQFQWPYKRGITGPIPVAPGDQDRRARDIEHQWRWALCHQTVHGLAGLDPECRDRAGVWLSARGDRYFQVIVA
jgi:hypothetical protein